jgi:hypothetical protein
LPGRPARTSRPTARASSRSRFPRADESDREKAAGDEWRRRYAEELKDLYADWLPSPRRFPTSPERSASPPSAPVGLAREGVPAWDALLKVYIPYIAYWSFGERVPVVEKPEDNRDERSINAAYIKLASLILNRLEWEKLDEGAAREKTAKALEEERTRYAAEWRKARRRLITAVAAVSCRGGPRRGGHHLGRATGVRIERRG